MMMMEKKRKKQQQQQKRIKSIGKGEDEEIIITENNII